MVKRRKIITEKGIWFWKKKYLEINVKLLKTLILNLNVEVRWEDGIKI